MKITTLLLSITTCCCYSGDDEGDAQQGAGGQTPSPAAAEILGEMAALDRAYIPALFLTSRAQAAPARQAMERLQAEWSRFRAKHYDRAGDELWQSDLDDVAARINRASTQVASSDSLHAAHETLEGIRVRMRELRIRNGWDYYLDHLTVYHEPMEAIVLTVQGVDAADLSDDAVHRIEQLLPEAMADWHAVQAAELDRAIFRLSPEDAARIEGLVAEEQAALDSLAAALASDDRPAIVRRGASLKPVFARLVTSFGEFGDGSPGR